VTSSYEKAAYRRATGDVWRQPATPRLSERDGRRHRTGGGSNQATLDSSDMSARHGGVRINRGGQARRDRRRRSVSTAAGAHQAGVGETATLWQWRAADRIGEGGACGGDSRWRQQAKTLAARYQRATSGKQRSSGSKKASLQQSRQSSVSLCSRAPRACARRRATCCATARCAP